MTLILRCGLLLSTLSYQLLTFTAVAQNACIYSSTENGTCKPYADCIEIHGQMLFENAACKRNTYCCPNNLITPPLAGNINNHKPNENTNFEDVNAEKIWNLFNEDRNPLQFGNENAPAPASDLNVGISQPIPNFNTNQKPETTNQKPTIPVDTVDLDINVTKEEEDGYFNPSVNDSGPKEEISVDPVNLDIKNPMDEEDRYFSDSEVKKGVAPANQVISNLSPTPTTLKPITTTTEAIPHFDEVFYRRLGLAFGNKYNIYHQQPGVTPENSNEGETVIKIAEEVTTNSTNFMKNLNLVGLHKLSLQKCGFVHVQNIPSVSNVEAHLLELPWLALLRYTGEAKTLNFSCGGSLITERWVLTAASCIKKTLIGVRLGEYEISEKSKKDCVQISCSEYKDFKIANTVKHLDYKPETGVKDIALIKLKEQAKKSKSIKPICLPTKFEYFNVPYDDTSLTISGWGLNKEGATKVMKKHAISRKKLQACRQANPAQAVHQSKLCLATVDEEPSTCSGDPGGPVSWIVDDSTQFVTQIGVVPFGMDKCGATEGAVSKYYVESVADSMDWITKVIGEDM